MGSTEDSPTAHPRAWPFSGRTAWARSVQTPLREFLRTETGGAAVLLAAAVAALVWVNVDASSYDSLWETTLSIEVGGRGVSLELREWVNSGLMTFFFFVLGLEARREFDLGDLRERRRFALPLLAAIGGMALAVAIYLAFQARGRPAAQPGKPPGPSHRLHVGTRRRSWPHQPPIRRTVRPAAPDHPGRNARGSPRRRPPPRATSRHRRRRSHA